MRIAFFTDTYYPDLNGVVISVDNFTKALREKGHEVYVFAPKIKGKYKDKDKYLTRLPSIKILAKVEPEIYSPTPWPNKAFRKMFTEDFDIIHAHGNGPYSFLGYSMAKLKGIPFVMTFHTIHTLYTHYIFNGKLITPRMVAVALKTFANRCDGILAPSEKMKKELRKYGVKKNISIIPNFLDTSKYQKYEEGYLHKRLNLAKETPLVLTVVRIGKEKNIDFLLKVFKLVFEQDKKTHFVIVGRGPERDNLESLAKKLGIYDRVHFTGLIEYEHMPSVYRDCLLFVFASYTETQGVCILEAAEAQVPSVVSDDTAFANMVVDGENGFTLPLDEKSWRENPSSPKR